MTQHDKPRLLRLDPARLDDELSDPGLAGLIASGWTFGPVLVLQDQRSEKTSVAVILVPPPLAARVVQTTIPSLVATSGPWFGVVGFLLAVVAAALSVLRLT